MVNLRVLFVFLLIALLACKPVERPLVAATPAIQSKGLSVTIYNQGIGLVKMPLKANLDSGVSQFSVPNIASLIDTSSVKLSGEIEVLEQNYQYDLADRNSLLKRYIGQEVTVIKKKPREEVTGKLLSSGGMRSLPSDDHYSAYSKYSPGDTMIESNRGIEITADQDFILPKTDGLLLQPTLDWTVRAPAKKAYDLSMMYITRGMSWTADYILELDPTDSVAGLKGWVTIDNSAGTTFEDAEIKLMAGDLSIEDNYPIVNKAMETDGMGDHISEEALFEYHMYTLKRKTTLRDKEEKQISLLEAEGVNVEKRFVYPGNGADVDVRIIFANSEKNSMGMALPKGKVKVFKKDRSGAMQFIGEDSIDHTPKDEKIELSIGQAFDIVVEKKESELYLGSSTTSYSYDVAIRNHKAEKVSVYVEQPLYQSLSWVIENENMKHIKESQKMVYWIVQIEPDSEKKLRYTVKYSRY